MINHTFAIPAYTDSPYLEECILSLKNQTTKGEIIITTSTPSDYIKNIANKYSIKYFVNNETRGLANDWNFAFSKAKTKFVTLAHQDDIYESDYLKKIFDKLEKQKNKRNLIIFTDYIDLIENKDRKISLNYTIKKILLFPFLIKNNISCKFIKKSVLLLGDPICCPAVTINKEIKDFSFSTDFNVNPDWFAWLELSKIEGSFVFINKRLMKHRIHEGMETMRQIKSNGRLEEELKMFQIMWGKRMGKLISLIYSFSHKNNILK